MTVIASVSLPATEFPLGDVLDPETEATVTVETTVPTSESVVPYLWVPGELTDDVLSRLEELEAVTSATVIEEVDDHALVRVDWDEEVNGVLGSIQETDALVTGAVGTPEEWTFRLRFPSYAELSAFYATCVDRGLSIELVRLHESVDERNTARFGLTEEQREMVLEAYDAGYFEVPRRTTLVELGESLEISDSAVSQRLRRGLSALIDSTLLVDTPVADSELQK